jgi:hypothetical protein
MSAPPIRNARTGHASDNQPLSVRTANTPISATQARQPATGETKRQPPSPKLAISVACPVQSAVGLVPIIHAVPGDGSTGGVFCDMLSTDKCRSVSMRAIAVVGDFLLRLACRYKRQFISVTLIRHQFFLSGFNTRKARSRALNLGLCNRAVARADQATCSPAPQFDQRRPCDAVCQAVGSGSALSHGSSLGVVVSNSRGFAPSRRPMCKLASVVAPWLQRAASSPQA